MYIFIAATPHKWKLLSRVRLFATPWTIQSMEFSRPEYWSGYPIPSPGDLPNLRSEPGFPALQADSLSSEPISDPMATPSVVFWGTSTLFSMAAAPVHTPTNRSGGRTQAFRPQSPDSARGWKQSWSWVLGSACGGGGVPVSPWEERVDFHFGESGRRW